MQIHTREIQRRALQRRVHRPQSAGERGRDGGVPAAGGGVVFGEEHVYGFLFRDFDTGVVPLEEGGCVGVCEVVADVGGFFGDAAADVCRVVLDPIYIVLMSMSYDNQAKRSK